MCRDVAGSVCRWGARRGACPAGRRLTVPFRNPQGGLPFGLPAAPDFSLLFCPHPPRPPSRREGGDQGYFMQGALPLASPGLNPGGTGAGSLSHPAGLAPCGAGLPCRRCTRRVACLLCRLLPLPLACFVAPIPPTRARRALFPAGRGRPRLFHARGFAPCIPGIRPPAALIDLAVQVPCG